MPLNSSSDDPKRQAIINSATRLFLNHGFRNVSMDKIAQAAPVSKATLYNHFDSKNALLAAVISTLCKNLLQTVSQATLETHDIKTSLHAIATSFVDLLYTEEALGMYRLIISESKDFPELGKLVYDSSAKIALTQLENYFQQLNANRSLCIADPAFAADAFFALLKGDLHFQCLLAVRPLPNEQEKNTLVNHAIQTYLQGILYAHE